MKGYVLTWALLMACSCAWSADAGGADSDQQDTTVTSAKDISVTTTVEVKDGVAVVRNATGEATATPGLTIVVNGQNVIPQPVHAAGNQVRGTIIINGQNVTGQVGWTQGTGTIATENRELGSFSRLHLGISADVTVSAGEKHRCTVTAEDNILPLILTECSGNELRISSKDNYSTTRGITIAIETPLLTTAELAGSGSMRITDVTKDELDLQISGSGNITASGHVANLNATIDGSGNMNAAGLRSKTATVTLNGSGDADVYVTDVLTARVHGSGSVTYAGSPPKVSKTVMGTGDITRTAAGQSP